MVRQAHSALVERDYVGDGAQGEEDRLARPMGSGDARSAWPAGEVDDRSAGPGVGRLEADEADLDAPRAGVVAILRYREASALDRQVAAVGQLERRQLDFQRRGRGRGGDGAEGEERGERRAKQGHRGSFD
jgi:hypothetical protein